MTLFLTFIGSSLIGYAIWHMFLAKYYVRNQSRKEKSKKRIKELYDSHFDLYTKPIAFKVQVDLKMLEKRCRRNDYTLLWTKEVSEYNKLDYKLSAYLSPEGKNVTLKQIRSKGFAYDMITCHREEDFVERIIENLLKPRGL